MTRWLALLAALLLALGCQVHLTLPPSECTLPPSRPEAADLQVDPGYVWECIPENHCWVTPDGGVKGWGYAW